MPELHVDDLPALISEYADEPLESAALPRSLFETSLKESVSVRSGALTFLVSGEASVRLFNHSDDEDPDRIIGTGSSEASDGGVSLGPQIQFEEGKAWLKYKLRGGTKADGTLEGTGFSFEASTDHSLAFSSYRVHDPDETVQAAVEDDLASPRLILSAEDIEELAPREAVAMQAEGTLGASLSARWADVFSGSLSALGGLVDHADAFAVSVDAGAQAHLDVEVEDAFTVVFSRAEPGTVRAAVKRRDRREVSGSVRAGITARLKDPDGVEEVLGDVVDALLGAAREKVESILDEHSALSEVDGDDLALITTVLERLGLEKTATTIEEIRTRIAGLKEEAAETLREIVESEIEARFSFEYARIDAETVLLEAIIDDERLGDVHGDVLRGNLRPVLAEASAAESGVALRRYFNEETTEVSRSWGLGLQFGEWFSVGSRSEVERTSVERRGPGGRLRQFSFTGKRFSKDESIGGASRCYAARLEASMQAGAGQEASPESRLTCGLTVSTQFREETLGEAECHRWLDLARLWRIVNPGAAPDVRDRIASRADGADAVTASFKIRLPDPVLKTVACQIAAADAEANADAFGRALGEAMVRLEDYGEVRQNPRQRRRYYGPLWAAYLKRSRLRPQDLARQAAETFREKGRSGLAHREGEMWRNIGGTIGGAAQRHPETRERWADFLEGMQAFARVIRGGEGPGAIGQAFEDMQRLWGQAFYLRALGVYVLDIVAQNPVHLERTERILTIDYETGEDTQVENISSTAAPRR